MFFNLSRYSVGSRLSVPCRCLSFIIEPTGKGSLPRGPAVQSLAAGASQLGRLDPLALHDALRLMQPPGLASRLHSASEVSCSKRMKKIADWILVRREGLSEAARAQGSNGFLRASKLPLYIVCCCSNLSDVCRE